MRLPVMPPSTLPKRFVILLEGCSLRPPISRMKIKIKRDAVRVRGMRVWIGVMK